VKIELTPVALDELRRIAFLFPTYGIPNGYPKTNTSAKIVTKDVGNAFVTKKGNLFCDKRAAQVIASVVGHSSGREGYELWSFMENYDTATDEIIDRSYKFPQGNTKA